MDSHSTQVDVQEASSRLSELLEGAERGDDIVIARDGVPVVRLQRVNDTRRRTFGVMQLDVPDDFDDPLPGDELVAWG